MQKHALIIQDISCVGRCSLLAALPVFNACGIRTTPLPTALLSTHTAFDNPHRLDLTQDMAQTLAHWSQLPLRFDLIHVGYLAGAHQLPAVQRAVDAYHRDGALLCVDPAMGDWGKAYAYCDDALLAGFRKQVEVAVPMPNVPEMTIVWSPATTAMNTIIRGAATPKVALGRAQAQVVKEVAGLRKAR